MTDSPKPSQEPYSVVMEVGPELAFKWLEGNTHNRPINGGHVHRLAEEIKADRWRLTHQGIAFDTQGILIDGQHRLWAVVEADRPILTRVFYHEPPENRQVLDCGERRSNLDILTLTGQVGKVTAKHLATLRAMLAGRSAHAARMTPGHEAEQFQRHREALDFAVQHLGACPTKGVATSTVRAVVARAYYSADLGHLAHFCDILKSGMATGEVDNGVLMLWQFLVRTQEAGKGESARRLRYAKTQWALSAFLRGKVPQRLLSADRELFPLPGETKEQTAA